MRPRFLPLLQRLEERIVMASPAAQSISVPGDYEGIGKTDLAVFRPSTDQWIIQRSDGSTLVKQFGDPAWGDIPVPGDYEGIGKTDLAVFRPSTDQWIIRLSDGGTLVEQFGDPAWGDIPVPGDYGDGRTDLAVFRPATDQSFIYSSGVVNLITPAPYNGWASQSAWMTLHDDYVSRANGHSIVFLGDSTATLWTNAGLSPQSSLVLSHFDPPRGMIPWDAMIAPLGAVDFGIPGDWTQDLLWRVYHGEVSGDPKVAVVMIGINDLYGFKSPIATAEGVIAVVQAIHAESPVTKVLLCAILAPQAQQGNPLLSEISTTNAILSKWASEHGTTFYNPNSSMLGYVDNHGHPAQLGYPILASGLLPLLKNLLIS